MKKGQIEIHSQNILPIIKKWLYSEKDIFIRELVSNACDAITKRGALGMQKDETPRIDITLDKEKKTITVSDNGIGMTEEETEKYLAQIAFSGAEEFVKAYQTDDAFIGHFGLGFYSSYMVADLVEVDTLSCKEETTAVLWKCDGTEEYVVEASEKKNIGTNVILHINEENKDYLEEGKIRTLLQRFCQFFPYPVYFNDSLINSKEPLWVKMPAECEEKEYKEFYNHLYPFEEEPLFWMHLNVDYPFHVKGILYFPRMKKDLDLTKNTVSLYSSRVFVSDNCKEILPEYLTMLKGVIDSPDIPLNVSRSYLQVDKTVRNLATHISKKVVDSLSKLLKNDSERYYKVYRDVEIIIKLAILHNDKAFERAKDDLVVWKTNSDEWITVSKYIEKNGKTIYYTHPGVAYELLELYKEKGIDVIISDMALDSALFAHLEKSLDGARFKRIDADMQALVDPSKEKTVLDDTGKTESLKIADFVKNELGGVTVEAKSLASNSLPGFISFSEEERRLRDYLQRMSPDTPMPQNKETFIVNTNSPLIEKIFDVKDKEPDLASLMIKQLYQLAKLSQREFSETECRAFVSESFGLLDKVSQKLS